MEDAKFHVGVEFILSRMESNPKEFIYESGKWRSMLETNTRWMSKEEKEAVNGKLRDINLEHMRTQMMKRILTDKEREMAVESSNPYTISNGTTGVSWASNTKLTISQDEILALPRDEKETLLKLIQEYQENNGSAY